MKIADLIQALTEAKKQNPHFDFNMFNLVADKRDIVGLGADMKTYTINLELKELEVPIDPAPVELETTVEE